MILSTFIDKVHKKVKANARTPSVGQDKYNLYLSTANDLIEELATKNKVKWDFLFEVRDLGTISAGDFTLDLDDDIHALSDYIYVYDGDTLLNRFPTVKPTDRGQYIDIAYVSGHDSKVLTFHDEIATDSTLVGGTISAGVYVIPEALVNPTDIIPVPAQWLIHATAAEIVRNDPAKDDQYATLAGRSDELYEDMIAGSVSNGYLQPSTVQSEWAGFNIGGDFS